MSVAIVGDETGAYAIVAGRKYTNQDEAVQAIQDLGRRVRTRDIPEVVSWLKKEFQLAEQAAARRGWSREASVSDNSRSSMQRASGKNSAGGYAGGGERMRQGPEADYYTDTDSQRGQGYEGRDIKRHPGREDTDSGRGREYDSRKTERHRGKRYGGCDVEEGEDGGYTGSHGFR